MSRVSLAAAEPQEPEAAPQGLVVGLESWDDFWPEVDALWREHWHEVDEGVESRRRYAPDIARMRAMQVLGIMHIITARRAGRLVAYATWTISPDVESMGLIIAHQGAWYAAPGVPTAGYRVFEFSIAWLRSLGVHMIYPHHRTQGRGSQLGAFFKRWGAKHIQSTYSLWIGADAPAEGGSHA